MMDGTTITLLGLVATLLLAVIYLSSKMLRLRHLHEKERHAHAEHVAGYDQLRSAMEMKELARIESKLDPHLFKNVLNTIQSHAFQTYFAIDKLSNVLDFVLYESKRRLVSPQEEIEFALNLIEINKIKLSPLFDLNVKVKVDESDPLYREQLLAPLISIDLIQNAFKHVDLRASDAFISIVLEFKASEFTVTVANTASSQEPLRKVRSGLGTDTLEQRLRILYKDRFSFERHSDDNVYFAQLKIRLHEYAAALPVVGR